MTSVTRIDRQIFMADRLTVDSGLDEVGHHVELGIAGLTPAVVDEFDEVVGQRRVRLGGDDGVGTGETEEDLAHPVDHLRCVVERKPERDEEHLGREHVGEIADEVAAPFSRNVSIVSRQAVRAIGVRRSTAPGENRALYSWRYFRCSVGSRKRGSSM